MNTSDILKYGHEMVVQAVDGLPEEAWRTPGVCGVWSVKDVIAHLASSELLIEDAVRTFGEGGPTPHLDAYRKKDPTLNDTEVASRRELTVARTLGEYTEVAERVMARVAKLPAETVRRVGTLPWFGEEYSLEDLIVYFSYGHKCEHCAQIAVFRDRLKARSAGAS